MLAIIPARAGSKRLPNKNKLLLDKLPLIVYTIRAALKSPSISLVIVTTDDKEIIDICAEFNVEVDNRSPHLSSETANIWEVCDAILRQRNLHDLDFILLQPTSPLRTTKHIEEAIQQYKTAQLDFLVSVCTYTKPIFWAKEITKHRLLPLFDAKVEKELVEKQIVHPNGAIYCINSKNIFKDKRLLDTGYYIMSQEESIDIDTKLDFLLAEVLIRANTE